MSWRAQSRSKDATTPSVGRAISEKPELDLRPVQPYAVGGREMLLRSEGWGQRAVLVWYVVLRRPCTARFAASTSDGGWRWFECCKCCKCWCKCRCKCCRRAGAKKDGAKYTFCETALAEIAAELSPVDDPSLARLLVSVQNQGLFRTRTLTAVRRHYLVGAEVARTVAVHPLEAKAAQQMQKGTRYRHNAKNTKDIVNRK
jgi:hypothetical protein